MYIDLMLLFFMALLLCTDIAWIQKPPGMPDLLESDSDMYVMTLEVSVLL